MAAAAEGGGVFIYSAIYLRQPCIDLKAYRRFYDPLDLSKDSVRRSSAEAVQGDHARPRAGLCMAAAAGGGDIYSAPACIATSEQLLAARIYLLICARHLFACAFTYLQPKLSLQPEPFG